MLTIAHGYKSFIVNGQPVPVLQDINLHVKPEEFVVIVGHSGCGKSTLLRMAAGLNHFDSGEILFKGEPILRPATDRGMVFQDHRLLPWLTIRENIHFALNALAKPEKEALIDHFLKMVNLTEFADAYPHQLSGGMSQRAAIARTLVTHPELVLLDEPLGALDALTKISLQRDLLALKVEKRLTMLLVTHDIEEAVYLGNRVVIMSSRPGRVKKVVNIALPFPRNRGSADFAHYKDLIMKDLFENSPALFAAEYEI